MKCSRNGSLCGIIVTSMNFHSWISNNFSKISHNYTSIKSLVLNTASYIKPESVNHLHLNPFISSLNNACSFLITSIAGQCILSR
nr:MAG TPA: hypothetical protein [Caudoviricetes sp.]